MGVAISAELTDNSRVAFYGLAAFEDSTLAAVALEMAVNRIEAEFALPYIEVAAGQNQEIIWTRILVDFEHVAEALEEINIFE